MRGFLFVCLLLLGAPSWAQVPYPGEPPYGLPPRLALVVGIDNYAPPVGRLEAAVSDARAVAEELRVIGFRVTELIGAVPQVDNQGNASNVEVVTRERLLRAIDVFARDIRDAREQANGRAPLVVLYFAGHGFHANGLNHLIVQDTRFSSMTMAVETAVPLYLVTRLVYEAGPLAMFVITDACRNYFNIELGPPGSGRGSLTPWFQNRNRAELRSTQIPGHLRIPDEGHDDIFFLYATMEGDSAQELLASQESRASAPRAEGGRFTLSLVRSLRTARQRSARSQSRLLHEIARDIERDMNARLPAVGRPHLQRPVFDYRQAYDMKLFPTRADFAVEQQIYSSLNRDRYVGNYDTVRTTVLCNLRDAQFTLRYSYFGAAIEARMREEGLDRQVNLKCDVETDGAVLPIEAPQEELTSGPPSAEERASLPETGGPRADQPARSNSTGSASESTNPPRRTSVGRSFGPLVARVVVPDLSELVASRIERTVQPTVATTAAPAASAILERQAADLQAALITLRAQSATNSRVEIEAKFDGDEIVLSSEARAQLLRQLSILGGMGTRSIAVIYPRNQDPLSIARAQHLADTVIATLSPVLTATDRQNLVPIVRRAPEALPDLQEDTLRVVLDVFALTDTARAFQEQLRSRSGTVRFVAAQGSSSFRACPVTATGETRCGQAIALWTPPEPLQVPTVLEGALDLNRSIAVVPMARGG
jgi:hypothetical protein